MNWEDINWVDGHIGVLKPKQVTRWRPRNVTMLPVFRRHLEPFALKEGPIFPRGDRSSSNSATSSVKALGLDRIGRTTACVTASPRITSRSTTIIPN